MPSVERPTRAPVGAVITAFALSRGLAYVAGVRFDASSLPWFWQFIDPNLLRSDPLRSLFFHHGQPPGFNAYLAVVLGLAGEHAETLFAISYLALGLALHLGLYGVLRALALSPGWASCITIGFAISPASILYERWLFYTYPMAAVLVLAALFLHRLISRGGQRADALVFFGLIAVAALTRSLFHLLWVIAVCGLAVWGARGLEAPARRRIVLAVLVPLVATAGLYTKNAALVGSFTGSTWVGMNLARLATEPVPRSERLILFERGEISHLALIPPWGPLDYYPPSTKPLPGPDHPVLRDAFKSTRAMNFNHVAYVALSRGYLADARRLMVHHPGSYLASVGQAWLLFLLPPSEYQFLDDNRARVKGWDTVYNALVYGNLSALSASSLQVDRHDPAWARRHVSWVLVLLGFPALLFALYRGISSLVQRDSDRAQGATLLFIAGTIVFVAVVGNAFELLENNRFRFMVEPLWIALVAWSIAVWVRERRARRASDRG